MKAVTDYSWSVDYLCTVAAQIMYYLHSYVLLWLSKVYKIWLNEPFNHYQTAKG